MAWNLLPEQLKTAPSQQHLKPELKKKWDLASNT